MASLERPKDKDRALLCDLLHTLSQRTNPSSASSGGQQGEMLLTPADVSEAVLQVLDELDDVIIDVPKAVSPPLPPSPFQIVKMKQLTLTVKMLFSKSSEGLQ